MSDNPPNLPRTTILVNERLPKDLTNIVLSYFKSAKRNWESISHTGEYETCLQIPVDELNWGLYKACHGGHMEIVQLIISRDANNWNDGLYGACHGGHIELVNLMISKGANDWNWGLHNACLGGHMKIAKLMIAKGANDWNYGLYGACLGNHTELTQLMISKGATECRSCNKPVSAH